MCKDKTEDSPPHSNKDESEISASDSVSNDDSQLNRDLEDVENQVEVPVEVKEALEILPEKEREIVQHIFSRRSTSSYSAPIPPPSYVAEYERIRPGSADDIFGMARKEQEIKETAIKGQLRNEGFTISVAFVGVLGLVVVTGITATMGQLVVPLITGLSAAAVLALKAVIGRNKRK